VEADRAAVEQAQINLGYTTMRAPTSGRIGRRQVDVGNLVGGGQDTLLASIVQLDPIYVYFSVPERDVPTLLAQRGKRALPVTLALGDRTGHPHQGRVDFVDTTVDASTGTFKVRAVVPNPSRVLLPGQFAQVRLSLGERPDTVLVPQAAVMEEQGGQAVLVVGPDRKVEARPVMIGASFEGLRIVDRGVRAGEEVIVEGLQKVRAGMTVDPTR
jgi:RND family efflux transporter MFP subunit